MLIYITQSSALTEFKPGTVSIESVPPYRVKEPPQTAGSSLGRMSLAILALPLQSPNNTRHDCGQVMDNKQLKLSGLRRYTAATRYHSKQVPQQIRTTANRYHSNQVLQQTVTIANTYHCHHVP